MWEYFSNNINSAFLYVVDMIIALQDTFISEAKKIGAVVLLIAILTAAPNYALTGTGLKENIIKIGKATLFFIIVIFAYPKIIAFITSWTFQMAEQSIYDDVKKHFDTVTDIVITEYQDTVSVGNTGFETGSGGLSTYSFTKRMVHEVTKDDKKLFSNLSITKKNSPVPYTVVAPAAVMQVIFFLAGECIKLADNKEHTIFPDFSRILKGLACAAILMFTGVFALLEYIICFLEFMLVASVGVILFPLSIWEGSKFLSEKFIGAIVGFFIKLLFCNIAIFLMLYGFVSLFYIITGKGNTFTANPDQILFIVFTSLLFFFICKSAPGIAQSLLTGTPSLSASGAIAAVGGAVAAAGAVGSMAKDRVSGIGKTASSIGGGVTKLSHTLAEAGAAGKAAQEQGRNGTVASLKSLGHNASQALARSLYGGGYSNNRSLGQIKSQREIEGAAREGKVSSNAGTT